MFSKFVADNECFTYEFEDFTRLSLDKLLEISNGISKELPSAEYDNSTFFDFYVNDTLQGKPNPCKMLDCRIRNVEKTLRFSTLYAERLVFVNPFQIHICRILDNFDKGLSVHAYYDLFTEIKLLKYLSPYISSGLIKYGSSNIHLCPNCLNKHVLYRNDADDFEKNMLLELENTFLKDISVTYMEYEHGTAFRVCGPEEIIPHGKYLSIIDREWLKTNKTKFSLNNNKELTDTEIREIGILNELNFSIFQNILFGNYYARTYGTQNLTDNKFEFQVNQHYKIKNSSSDTIEILEHSMPFIYDVELAKVLELRRSEEDAFNNYRETVRRALKDIKNIENTYEKTEAFADIIRPGIKGVEDKIKKSRSKLLKTLTKDILIASGSIYLATNNTMFDPTLASYVAAGGGLEVAKDVITNAKLAINSESLVKDDPFYFLWKLKKDVPSV